jgi:urease accessory protein
MRARHLDRDLPDLASIIVASPSGGILQGDLLETMVEVGDGARLHVGTQSATRIYRCPEAPATCRTELTVRSGGYLEFLPDPYLPYAGSRVVMTTVCHVADDATLILGEVVTGGRLARGECWGLDRFESAIDIRRIDGDLLARDALRLDDHEPAARIGRLGAGGAVGTLFVVQLGFSAEILREALAGAPTEGSYAGASDLPNGAGAWLRVLAPDGREAIALLRAGWVAARRTILGFAPPLDRRA